MPRDNVTSRRGNAPMSGGSFNTPHPDLLMAPHGSTACPMGSQSEWHDAMMHIVTACMHGRRW